MSELTRILYVEDDEDIRTVAQFALEAVGGFTVRACGSGKEALGAASSFAPELLLLDVMMPEMDGPMTLAEFRDRPETRTTPAIFMTAKVQAHEIARYMKSGAIGVIPKPFDPLLLADEIRSIWRRADDTGRSEPGAD